MQVVYDRMASPKNGRVIDNAIFSKYPILDSSNTVLPQVPRSWARGLLRASVSVNGNVIRVWGTHLHYATSRRMDQAHAVATAVGDPTCTNVLAGDFNLTPSTPAHRVLTRHLTDTFTTRRSSATSPSRNPRNRIDYLFHSRQATPTGARVLPHGASDHRGVSATYALEPSSSCR